MNNDLYYNTITDHLLKILKKLMSAEEFEPFRLVGGTSLSLQLGHRLSIDIDLFTDSKYGTINFEEINHYLKKEFLYVDSPSSRDVGMGCSYYIGDSAEDCVKLDLFYTDEFIRPYIQQDGIRLATIEEIAAMKLDVVARGGRKKDFWDIHEMTNNLSISEMLTLHSERYPYTHTRSEIIEKFSDFSNSDNDIDPECHKGKYWEIIKLDIVEAVDKLKETEKKKITDKRKIVEIVNMATKLQTTEKNKNSLKH